MNFYQNKIKTGILFLTFVLCYLPCYSQEASVRVLNGNTSKNGYDRYAPIFESRTNQLLWTQRNVGNSGDTVDKLFYSKNGNSQASQFDIMSLPYNLSSIGTCNISLDGSTIVFSGAKIAKDTTWFIMTAQKTNNQFYYSTTIDSGTLWMGHPCLSLNDSMIVFSAIKKQGTKSDLYFSARLTNDKWSKSIPLSDKINTPHEELSPFLTNKKNNPLLYFSSDRPNGKGGLDIYSSQFDVTTKTWSNPQLMSVVNTEYDESFASVPHDTSADNILYFASNRNKYNWDIYTASPNPEPPIYIIVRGTVFNISYKNQINPIQNSNVIFRNFSSSKRLSVVSTDNSGQYIAKMPLDVKLYVEAYSSGKASKDTLVYYSSEKLKNMQSVRLDFYLKDSFNLVTDTMFFEYGKAELKINSRVELILQRISDYLKMNPKNQIKIVGA